MEKAILWGKQWLRLVKHCDLPSALGFSKEPSGIYKSGKEK